MLSKNTSTATLLVSLVVSGMVASAGFSAFKAMQNKAQAQVQAVSDFQDWKLQYTKLLPLEEKWTKAIRPLSEVKDVYSLYQMLGDQPSSNPDTLLVQKLERVKQNGRDLGVSRVCLVSGGSTGVSFTEKVFSTLMQGLGVLAKRPDIQMGTVHVTQSKAQAQAYVSPLCILFRDEEGAKR